MRSRKEVGDTKKGRSRHDPGKVKAAHPTSGESVFDSDVRFYKEHFHQLLSMYEGKFIALVAGQVVDSDVDFSRLAERVYAKFGYRDIFMPKVEEPRVISMPSPRLAGRG